MKTRSAHQSIFLFEESSMTQLKLPTGMEITGEIKPGYENILTPKPWRWSPSSRAPSKAAARNCWPPASSAKRLDAGERPDFLPETESIRKATGRSRPCPRP
jgi:malate synthase